MLTVLERMGKPILGSGHLLMDAEATRAAMKALQKKAPSVILVLQVTFTDATTIAKIAARFAQQVTIGAVPEPHLGGRLRLNAFCGLNLASHALGLRNRSFSGLYRDPADDDIEAEIDALLTRIDVDELPPDTPFDEARHASRQDVDPVRTLAAGCLEGPETVNQDQLERSLRHKVALDHLRDRGRYDAFAIRCWPETFTEYGGAVCRPVSMMGEQKIPCACEADVYGAASQFLLQTVAVQPMFLVDLVDLDPEDDTGVVSHCGQAPVSMADPDAAVEAVIHGNRRMPLLYRFALKPGTVTFARLSQAYGEPKLVVAGTEVLKRPMAFTGTSGVVRFRRPAGEIMEQVMNSGLEHHMALAYGDHTEALVSTAAALGLPVL